jgi:hypothetical protein
MNERLEPIDEPQKNERFQPIRLEGFGGVDNYLIVKLAEIIQDELKSIANNPDLSDYTSEQLAEQVMRALKKISEAKHRDSIVGKITEFRNGRD